MAFANTLRPGVFSQYTVSSLYGAGRSRQYAALLAPCDSGALSAPRWAESYAQGAALLADDTVGAALTALRLLFVGGVSRVWLAALPPEPAASDYQAAMALLKGQQNLYAVVCATDDEEALAEVKASVLVASQNQRERIAFCGFADPETAPAAAQALDSERMVLVCPGGLPAGQSGGHGPLLAAAALAAAVLTLEDPAASLSGYTLPGLDLLETTLTDQQVETLLAAGITPLEQVGGAVQCVRALTTRTTTGGAADRSFAPVNTTLIIDHVMTAVRGTLLLLLRGAKSTLQSYNAVASQVIVLLSEKQAQGIITGFDGPAVAAHPDDPSICVVELSFGVAYAVNQIHIKTHVLV